LQVRPIECIERREIINGARSNRSLYLQAKAGRRRQTLQIYDDYRFGLKSGFVDQPTRPSFQKASWGKRANSLVHLRR
jgi:hypothetical protein